MKFSKAQCAKAQKIVDASNLKKLVAKILTYKGRDEGLALFRVTAGNKLQEIILRHVNNKPLTNELKTYLSGWLVDSGEIGGLFTAVIEELEKHTNKIVIGD